MRDTESGQTSISFEKQTNTYVHTQKLLPVKMINIAGVVSIVLFYLLILAVGIWAGRKKEEGNDSEEEVMLAGRSIGLFVGIFTMTGNFYLIIMFSMENFSFQFNL